MTTTDKPVADLLALLRGTAAGVILRFELPGGGYLRCRRYDGRWLAYCYGLEGEEVGHFFLPRWQARPAEEELAAWLTRHGACGPREV